MVRKFIHVADQQILLYTDGELRWLDAIRIRTHMVICAPCRARMECIRDTLSNVAQTYRHTGEPIAHLSGPRALLKARLEELAHNSSPHPSRQLRFARNLAYLCALALLAAIGVGVSHQYSRARLNTNFALLPDPTYTPGSTRQVSLADICSADRDEVVRNVPASVQQRVFQEYGIKGLPATDFEVDYLITPGLGGSDDVHNLWPQPHSNTWNSYVKDQLEDHLHRMVCDGRLSLGEAQRDIATNWISAYKKYFHTELPLGNPLEAALIQTPHTRFALRRKQRAS